MSLGLDRMRLLLDELGRPEERLRFVHVAGTNGKGSTCAYLDSICRKAGLKCGLFTSPYIERFEERIRVDGTDIAPDDLLDCTVRVRDAAAKVERTCGEHPTEFELMCAVALVHFERQDCDICIMEVGLGGRLDATNVIQPDACAITRIGLDHTSILGDTIEEIAAEKAGIIKPHAPVISAPQDPRANAVIEKTCDELECKLVQVSTADIEESHISGRVRRFSYQGKRYETKLLGAYQPENAAVAIECAQTLAQTGWPITEDAISDSIQCAEWPGRFEVLGTEPLIIVDGAHNPQGSLVLKDTIDELLGEDARPIYVIGCLADKDVPQILAPHLSRAKRIFAYAPENPRALPSDELSRLIANMEPNAQATACEGPAQAIAQALGSASADDAVIAFGSLYSIGAIKKASASYSSSSGISRP